MREYHVRSGRWKAGLVRRSSRKRFAAEERTKRKCEVTAAGSAKDSGRKISDTAICEFERYLHREGKKKSTVDKYLRDVRSFQMWLRQSTEERGTVERETAGQWRDFLCGSGYAPVTVNAMLTSLNLFFRFSGWEECRAKTLRIQRRFFRSSEKELFRREYERLVKAAKAQGKERLALLLETICATGIRVSEVKNVTLEAICEGRVEISLKGKIRTILMPEKLCRKLIRYAGQKKIVSGEIFITRSGKSLSRQQIWAEMKKLCPAAGILKTKVFPHNLRHLFARAFYRVCGDIVKLADVLGHSNLATTRIYLTSTGAEHARHLERLRAISEF